MSAIAKVSFRRKPWEDPSERAEIVRFGPEDAREILGQHNPENRPCNKRHVGFLSRELTEGYWRRNGETIVFDRDGRLRNGQHRLTACAETGIPLESWVIFGVEPEVFDTIDRTRRRQASDDLAISGESNYTNLAASLALACHEDSDDLHRAGDPVNHHQVRAAMAKHPQMRQAAAETSCRKKLTRLLRPSIATFCLYRFSAIDQDKARTFFDGIETGEDLDAESPILKLRDRLIDNATSKAKVDARTTLALTIKAWNAFIGDRSITCATARKDLMRRRSRRLAAEHWGPREAPAHRRAGHAPGARGRTRRPGFED